MKKILLITGSGSDIGLEIANTFIKENFYVILNIKSKKSINKINRKLSNYNDCFEIFLTDISDQKKNTLMFKKIFKKYEKIDLLVNNAAKTDNKNKKLMLKNYYDIFGTNFFGALNTSLNYLKQSQKGSKQIINISSIVVTKGSYNFPAYASSKIAFDNASMSLSKIFKSVRFVSLILGKTNTSKFRSNHNIKNNETLNDTITPLQVANKTFQIYKNKKQYLSGTSVKLNK